MHMKYLVPRLRNSYTVDAAKFGLARIRISEPAETHSARQNPLSPPRSSILI